MPAPILAADSSLEALLDEATYTHARLEAHPLGAPFAADFTSFFKDWTAVRTEELKLHGTIVRGNALIAAVDDDLDELVDAVQQAVLLQTKNDRKSALYLLYFGAKRPSELKRPVLGAELETMRGWIPSLLASPNKVLSAIGARVKQKVTAADATVAAQGVAEQKNRDFRTIGARKALVDSLNALRKATYGKLSELPHANPDEHLPATFAEPFFRHDTGPRTAAPTAADLTKQIQDKEAQLAPLRAQLAKAIADEEMVAKLKTEADADAAALAQAEKEADEAAARVAALKAKKKV